MGWLGQATETLEERRQVATYGMISSLRPLRKRIGIFVILGSASSVGHIWWHRGARKRAGGKALNWFSDVTKWKYATYVGISFLMEVKVFSKMMPAISPSFWFRAANPTETAPPILCP